MHNGFKVTEERKALSESEPAHMRGDVRASERAPLAAAAFNLKLVPQPSPPEHWHANNPGSQRFSLLELDPGLVPSAGCVSRPLFVHNNSRDYQERTEQGCQWVGLAAM